MEFILSVFYAITGIILLLLSFFYIFKEYKRNDKKFNSSVIWFSLIGIFVSIFLLIGTYVINGKVEDYNKKRDYNVVKNIEESGSTIEYEGTLGDLFGGIYGPIVGLIGALFGGLAFYAQFVANKEIQKQFEIQKFESQFYERLKFLKEEIQEIKLISLKKDDIVGRQVFYELDKEIKFIYLIICFCVPHVDSKTKFNICYDIFYFGRKDFFLSNASRNKYENLSSKEWSKLEENFLQIYKLFKRSISDYDLLQVDKYKKEIIPQPILASDLVIDDARSIFRDFNNCKEISEELIDYFIQQDSNYVYKFIFEIEEISKVFYSAFVEKFETNIKHMPFQGMYTKFSLFYRQIFGIVKFIVNNNILEYEEKRSYLRVLRSILGNYEQLHLFYNWYGEIGVDWEINNGNKFLTDYRMIHNIPVDFLIEDIDLKQIFIERDFKYEKDKKTTDSLFENLEIISIL